MGRTDCSITSSGKNYIKGGRDGVYQKEHSGLHDLPRQLHQEALFQKDLEHNVSEKHPQ